MKASGLILHLLMSPLPNALCWRMWRSRSAICSRAKLSAASILDTACGGAGQAGKERVWLEHYTNSYCVSLWEWDRQLWTQNFENTISTTWHSVHTLNLFKSSLHHQKWNWKTTNIGFMKQHIFHSNPKTKGNNINSTLTGSGMSHLSLSGFGRGPLMVPLQRPSGRYPRLCSKLQQCSSR